MNLANLCRASEIAHFGVFELQLQPVGNQGDELRIGGLAFRIGDGISEDALQRLQIAAIPGHLDGVADGSLDAAGSGVELEGKCRTQKRKISRKICWSTKK